MDEQNNGNVPQDNGWQTVNSPAGGNEGYIPPPPAQGGQVPVTESRNNTLGIIGLIAGIIGIILACCWPLGIVLGLTALICGIIGKSKGQRFAVAGIVLGIIALLLAIIVLVSWGALSLYYPDFMNEFMYEFQY